ncbi:MAG TPA: D-aminoacylase [Vicinamibacteria bacterium]|nr:D-aminoacylase [Vicinamibacteria bacterium]
MHGLLLAAFVFTGQPSQPESFDVLIENGRVLDGTGNPWYRADIAIRSGRIAAIGHLDMARADVVINASSLYVAPGFIDVHSHSGEGLLRPELKDAKPILAQGVTTLVLNPDGGGPWPLSQQRLTYESQGIGVNVALLVGHGTLRQEVMGMEDRPPSDDELEKMKSMVREGMRAGAFGLSSGLYYAPGSYAETEELVALAKEVRPRGVYSSHIRDEGDYTVGLLAAVEEVIRIAEEAAVSGVVTHFKALGPDNWGKAVAACVRIERARARGVSVWADQYPYAASGTSITGALVPRWAEAGETMPGGPTPLEARLRHPPDRARLRIEMQANLERRGGAETLQISRHLADPSIEGETLAQLSRERDQEPVDVALDLLDAGGASLVSFNMSEKDVAHIMQQDYTMTCSDGGLVPMGEGKPHPRFYGTFPRKIARYVKETGVVSLAHAIRSMTSLPATVFGLEGRGLLRSGARADVVVFDLESIRDRADYRDPHQLAEGVTHVLVNGLFAVRDGAFTEALAGEVLRPSN